MSKKHAHNLVLMSNNVAVFELAYFFRNIVLSRAYHIYHWNAVAVAIVTIVVVVALVFYAFYKLLSVD